MARKLAFDYTFNKAAKQIVLNGNVNPKRLLLINNATANIVIYNVGDPALKATASSYSALTDKTTITLNYDTTGMNNTDVLQIFTEEDGVEIKPVNTLLDPVSKFRVSEPNTLIDTDFEYGLQATKWETLERVNNIPGYYSISGDTPLTNISDVTTSGTKIVTVTTTSPHGLTTGIPIDVRGLDSVTAEGTFLVRKTTDYSFTYETRTVQPGSAAVPVSINTAYVTVTTGRFYVQSQVPLDNSVLVDEGPAVTDNASSSAITVTTPYKHGFKVGSPFYLTNTLSNKSVTFNSASISSGGEVEDRISYELDSGDFVPYEPFHDGTTLRTIDAATSISLTLDTITIPNHGLVTGDMISYLGTTGSHPIIGAVASGRRSNPGGNLNSYALGTGTSGAYYFFANVIDADTIKLATNPESANKADTFLDFTSTGTGTLTFSLWNKRGYEIQSDILSIQTVSGSSEVKVQLNTKTNKQLKIYPDRQITLSGTAVTTSGGTVPLDGVYVVKSTPQNATFSSSKWRETDTFFIMEGPVSNANANAFLNQGASTTYVLSNTAAASATLLRTKVFENTFTPTLSSISGSSLNVQTLTNLGDGDLPTRVGSIVRFTSVGSLTGVTANTDYWISALTSTSITLSSTNPVLSTTAVTLGGSVAGAVLKVFRSGVRCEVHDGAVSWQNSTRASVHDWCSILGKCFTREACTSTTIYIKNHGLTTGMPVLFVGAGSTWSGSADSPEEAGTGGTYRGIYYVSVVDKDNFSLRVSESGSGAGPYGSVSGNTVDFSDGRNNTYAGGIYQIHPGFLATGFTLIGTGGAGAGRDRVIAKYGNLPDWMTEQAEIIIKEGAGATVAGNLTNTPNTYLSYQKYYARSLRNSSVSGTGEFSVSLSDTGSPIDFAAGQVGSLFVICRISENPYSNSFYLPNHGGINGNRTNYATLAGNFTGGTQDTPSTYPSTAGFPAPLYDYVQDSTGVNWPRVSMNLFHANMNVATFNGTVSGNTLTLTSNSTGTIATGQYIQGSGIIPGTTITGGSGQTSGSTWTLSNTHTISNSTAFRTHTPTNTFTNLVNGSRYYMVPVTDDIFKVQAYSPSTLPTGQPTVALSPNLSFLAAATTSVSGPYGSLKMKFWNSAVANANGNRILMPIERQTLTEGDVVRYQSTGQTEIGSAYLDAPGLINGNLYNVRNVSDFAPLSTGLYTVNVSDKDANIITLNSNVSGKISAGNTLWTGGFLNERLYVNAAGAGTYTISGQSVTLTASQIHVTRGYGGTTAKEIPNDINLFTIYGSFQLQVRELSTPRSFTVAFGSTDQNLETWRTTVAHGLRMGETVSIAALSTGSPAGSYTNTITGVTTSSMPAPQLYYAIPIDSFTFQLAHSRAAAFAGFPLNIINPGTTGSWTFIQYYDSVPLASSATGTHRLINVSSTGTIDGSYDASSVTDSKMVFNTTSNIAPRSIVFDPAKNLDLRNGMFFYQDHGFASGTRVVYTKGGSSEIGRFATTRAGYNALFDIQITTIVPTGTQVTYNFATQPYSPFDIVANQTVTISGVTVGGSTNNGYNGTFKVISSTVGSVTVANTTTGAYAGTSFVSGTYYVIRKNLDQFQLAYTKQDALNGVAIQNYSDTGTTGVGHTLSTSQIVGESLGNGVATVIARDTIVNGSRSSFDPTTNNNSAILAASDRIAIRGASQTVGHNFVTGDRIIYQVWGNGKAISGLVSGRQYFVNATVNTVTSRGGAPNGDTADVTPLDSTKIANLQSRYFSLHNTWVGAYTNTDIVDILGPGTSTLHQFKVTNPSLKGSTFKGEWNNSDTYGYGDIILFRNSYYMSVTTSNNNQQPTAETTGRMNINWMLMPPLPSYTTKFLAQYRGGDVVKLSAKMPVRTLYITADGVTGTSGLVSGTSGIFNIGGSGTPGHGLQTGDAIIYKIDAQGGNHQGTNGSHSEYDSVSGGTGLPQRPFTNMTPNGIYYVNVIDKNHFTIHTNPASAFVGGSTAGSNDNQVIPNVLAVGAGRGRSHRFEKLEGAVIELGVIAINNDSDMIVTDPYPTRQITFNPQTTITAVNGLNTPVVNIERSELYLPNHGLLTGTKVYYSAGFGIGTAIAGGSVVTEGGTYYVIRINDDVIRLASSLNDALLLQNIVFAAGTGSGFTHYLVAATYCNSSYIRYEHDESTFSYPSNGKLATTNTISSPLYTGQTASNIRDGVFQAIPFLYETQMFVRPDCLNLHRSFDGGVEISAAKAPGVQITRQTRRYFRYQSGKGLQYSTGINFSPSIDVSYITWSGGYATVVTRKPHKLTASNKIIVEGVTVNPAIGSGSNTPYVTPANGLYFTVYDVTDEFTFRYATNGTPDDTSPSGFPALFVYDWTDAKVRAGMFDDQNGMFFEYDGQNLYCVRRNSTSQMSGTVACTFKSNAIIGSGTKFQKQLSVGDKIVIRGMTYKVTNIDSDTSIHISPGYRGTTRSKIIATKVRELRVPQSQWNIDKCDGSGVTGFKLDIHRQQMAYMDYSWYGAGKVRFGFKDQDGIVTYVHEFVHNNKENEAYLRSGNLPARYDIENGDSPSYAPSLYHWGASVIMDGKFEDDKAYLFTVASGSVGSDTVNVPGTLSGTAVPILSIRLAPSVDSSLVGPLGERDLINRMILKMNSCGIVCQPISTVTATGVITNRTDATSIRLILNGNLSQAAYFTNYGAPSLCQIIKHTGQSADTVTGGISIFEFRAAAGSALDQKLSDLVEMGNSILGGDYVYPNGPDVLTLAVVTTVPSVPATGSVGSTLVTARITWTESQA